MKFEIKHCSVLDAGADIIVNAANNYLSSGGGVNKVQVELRTQKLLIKLKIFI